MYYTQNMGNVKSSLGLLKVWSWIYASCLKIIRKQQIHYFTLTFFQNFILERTFKIILFCLNMIHVEEIRPREKFIRDTKLLNRRSRTSNGSTRSLILINTLPFVCFPLKKKLQTQLPFILQECLLRLELEVEEIKE